MGSVIQLLTTKKIISPPDWLQTNLHYETEMGSRAYGINDEDSDYDFYGFAIPPMADIFPHLTGEIRGFGKQRDGFGEYRTGKIKDGDTEYDITIYGIVKYFQLCMENNANMIDSMFTPIHCVRHVTKIGNMVRDNRRMFLHKGCYPKFRGYAVSQLGKMHNGRKGKREEGVKKYGFDLKFAVHTLRLALECEQILSTGDLDLTRDRVYLKSIRNGEKTEEEIREWFSSKEKHLERLYETSTLPYAPDVKAIGRLLVECLEEHYGQLRVRRAFSEPMVDDGGKTALLVELQNLINRHS